MKLEKLFWIGILSAAASMVYSHVSEKRNPEEFEDLRNQIHQRLKEYDEVRAEMDYFSLDY